MYTSKWSWSGCGPVHHSLIDWASGSSYGGWSKKLFELWTLFPRADLSQHEIPREIPSYLGFTVPRVQLRYKPVTVPHFLS